MLSKLKKFLSRSETLRVARLMRRSGIRRRVVTPSSVSGTMMQHGGATFYVVTASSIARTKARRMMHAYEHQQRLEKKDGSTHTAAAAADRP